MRASICMVENLGPHIRETVGFASWSVNLYQVLLCIINDRWGKEWHTPNFFNNSSGLAFRAAFLVPILLVISHPVRLCSAGDFVQVCHTEYEEDHSEWYLQLFHLPTAPEGFVYRHMVQQGNNSISVTCNYYPYSVSIFKAVKHINGNAKTTSFEVGLKMRQHNLLTVVDA